MPSAIKVNLGQDLDYVDFFEFFKNFNVLSFFKILKNNERRVLNFRFFENLHFFED